MSCIFILRVQKSRSKGLDFLFSLPCGRLSKRLCLRKRWFLLRSRSSRIVVWGTIINCFSNSLLCGENFDENNAEMLMPVLYCDSCLKIWKILYSRHTTIANWNRNIPSIRGILRKKKIIKALSTVNQWFFIINSPCLMEYSTNQAWIIKMRTKTGDLALRSLSAFFAL